MAKNKFEFYNASPKRGCILESLYAIAVVSLTGHPQQRSTYRTVLHGLILVQLHSILFTVYNNCSSEALMLNFTGIAVLEYAAVHPLDFAPFC